MCVIVIMAVSMLYSISSNVLYLHAYTFGKYWGNGEKTGFTGAKKTKCKLPRASIRVILYVSSRKSLDTVTHVLS